MVGWLIVGISELDAGEKIVVGVREPAQRHSYAEIDHTSWDSLLQAYVDDQGLVAYARWHGSAADRQKLSDYLDHLSTADMIAAPSQESEIAYWINAYNALTIHGILREYPTTSIRNHTAQLFGYNIWKDLQLQVTDQRLSLDDIEHGQLRHGQLRHRREPRIHFALVCASLGCPRLLNRAYTAEKLNEQLDENARHFFRQPQNFAFDPTAKRFQLSAILDWYGEDFGATAAERLRAWSPYLPTPAARDTAAQGQGSIQFLEYNWQLNDQSPPE